MQEITQISSETSLWKNWMSNSVKDIKRKHWRTENKTDKTRVHRGSPSRGTGGRHEKKRNLKKKKTWEQMVCNSTETGNTGHNSTTKTQETQTNSWTLHIHGNSCGMVLCKRTLISRIHLQRSALHLPNLSQFAATNSLFYWCKLEKQKKNKG